MNAHANRSTTDGPNAAGNFLSREFKSCKTQKTRDEQRSCLCRTESSKAKKQQRTIRIERRSQVSKMMSESDTNWQTLSLKEGIGMDSYAGRSST
jgi:hypothetical protein